ncbi:hypothetical protein V496_09143 [Pseudogymnoascus sp. VKM F-4515 (FW-2607)]|nr:hypothetical protein V496_09143 [Pseudogymnoascus sp. VKM F-4515 (FW-2607)]KFY86968.1 hypothetical protein V498_07329 [Pseudogymnoascus sp. VKM F-4517 (FW-2822)]
MCYVVVIDMQGPAYVEKKPDHEETIEAGNGIGRQQQRQQQKRLQMTATASTDNDRITYQTNQPPTPNTTTLLVLYE